MNRAAIPDSLNWVYQLMRDFPAPWCVAGGWAIDLFLNRLTRPHGDVEIAIFREDQPLLQRRLSDWEFQKVVDGQRTAWHMDDRLELPIHEIHARAIADASLAIEFLLNERIGDNWVYRRDLRVRLPIGRAFLTSACGLPVLNPAIVLLFKSKARRSKDEADYEIARGALDGEDRRWMCGAMQTCDPNNPWLLPLT